MGNESTSLLQKNCTAYSTYLEGWLQCPSCASTLPISNARESIVCTHCQQSFPILNQDQLQIPILLDPIDAAIQGWSARLNGFNRKQSIEQESLKSSIKDKSVSAITRSRLKHMLSAKQNFQEQVNHHLHFFSQNKFDHRLNVNSALAKNQGIDSYVNNIFRDWCWENGENQELLGVIERVCPSHQYDAGKVVTLGAGAGRCSFDFHRFYNATHSLLVDVNPFLLGIANKVINNQSMKLTEFPIAPKSKDVFAVEHEVKLPSLDLSQYSDKFEFLLADVTNIPLVSGAADTVLTPWLIDIIPMDLRKFIPHVNRLLNKGGIWVNTGSLAFFHKNEAWNYSEQEVLDLLKKYGFEVQCSERAEINYLHSPYSAHGRRESVFSFCAIKKFDSVPAERHHYLPDWITDTHLAIPQFNQLQVKSSEYLLQAQVLSAIDGNRSIHDVGLLVAQQYGMSADSAIAAVRQILSENFQEL